MVVVVPGIKRNPADRRVTRRASPAAAGPMCQLVSLDPSAAASQMSSASPERDDAKTSRLPSGENCGWMSQKDGDEHRTRRGTERVDAHGIERADEHYPIAGGRDCRHARPLPRQVEALGRAVPVIQARDR